MDARATQAHVLGGAFVPHAPQFFTMPETEDPATVASVRRAAARVGGALAALAPDLWIVVANDHVNQFFLHCTPSFTLHVGGTARGSFAGRDFAYEVASEASFALVRHLQAEGFDPAFTSSAEIDYAFGIPLAHLGVDAPIVPIYANAYVPPQPSMERCYAFGQALARGLAANGIRAVVVASGGMSHFPGTERYARPDLAFDEALLEPLRLGRLRTLLSLDERRLDEAGNVELRCWAVGAGALGERVPDLVQIDPSWHHIYGTLGWFASGKAGAAADARPHYPPVRADRVALTGALHRLSNDAGERARYAADPQGYAAAAGLSGEEAAALAGLDMERMRALGVHPMVPFLARLQIDHERARREGGPPEEDG